MTKYLGSNTPQLKRDYWQTPPALFTALAAEFRFQLDAAASPENTLCCQYITEKENTLTTDWRQYMVSERGYAWLNPPYSNITPFVRKAAAEADLVGTVMLVPADISVGWFAEALESVSEVRFITAGRIHFVNPVTGRTKAYNPKGSMLLIWHPWPRTDVRFSSVKREALMSFGERLLALRKAS